MANFATATGKSGRGLGSSRQGPCGFDEDVKASRRWLKETKGLTMVQANCVLHGAFPRVGRKGPPVRSVRRAQGLAAPRLRQAGQGGPEPGRRRHDRAAWKSQVTFARDVTFAVVRAAAKDRVDLALRLPGAKPTSRLVTNPYKATGSDPTHVPSRCGLLRTWMARSRSGSS